MTQTVAYIQTQAVKTCQALIPKFTVTKTISPTPTITLTITPFATIDPIINTRNVYYVFTGDTSARAYISWLNQTGTTVFYKNGLLTNLPVTSPIYSFKPGDGVNTFVTITTLQKTVTVTIYLNGNIWQQWTGNYLTINTGGFTIP